MKRFEPSIYFALKLLKYGMPGYSKGQRKLIYFVNNPIRLREAINKRKRKLEELQRKYKADLESVRAKENRLVFELKRMKKDNAEIQRKVEIVEDAARELGCTIILKGNVDLISNGQDTFMNPTGTPYMTVGGTGDTLAGICGALLARGIEPFVSACVAAYINGRAGEIAAKEKGEGLMPTDLIEAIPLAIKGK